MNDNSRFTDDDWNNNHVSVRAGTARRSSGGEYIRIKNHTWHEKFNKNAYDYNVAVLELDGSLTMSDSIQVIPLATQEAAAGSLVNVTLFGSLPVSMFIIIIIIMSSLIKQRS